MFQVGLTFTEVMIALLLLSISLIGVLRLEIFSLQTYCLSYQENIASAQIGSMINRIKANFNRLQEEIITWNQLNKELLPKGKGSVSCQVLTCNIQVTWEYQGKRDLSITLDLLHNSLLGGNFCTASERSTAAYIEIREDASTEAVQKLPAAVELCKRSI